MGLGLTLSYGDHGRFSLDLQGGGGGARGGGGKTTHLVRTEGVCDV